MVEYFDVTSLLVQLDRQLSSEILNFRLGLGVPAIKMKQSIKQKYSTLVELGSGYPKSCQKRLRPSLNCSDGLASSSDIWPLQMCLPHSHLFLIPFLQIFFGSLIHTAITTMRKEIDCIKCALLDCLVCDYKYFKQSFQIQIFTGNMRNKTKI
jgi:hypothetical protein